MSTPVKNTELSRLRNMNVSQIMRFLGGDVPPYIEAAIKRQFTSFAQDVENGFLLAEPAHTGAADHDDTDDSRFNR